MKTSLILFISTAIILTFSNILSKNIIPQTIFSAIENGDAKALSSYFNQSIELKIIDKEGIYGKKQAEILLKDFFSDNKPVFFEVIKQEDHVNSSFGICNFDNTTGQKFSVYVYVRNFGSKNIITKLKIEYL